ncbi:flagellar hook-length control protein FliK [Aquibacillus sediminis]|uniref:flagellar hook-length control protein FliK n=1 Tax=Aquibacillus sediminis TaxID=2574734 RepID=UPI001108B58B|nr:flagellar hook-length control protein FliK [Aquibacillus sediminis]
MNGIQFMYSQPIQQNHQPKSNKADRSESDSFMNLLRQQNKNTDNSDETGSSSLTSMLDQIESLIKNMANENKENLSADMEQLSNMINQLSEWLDGGELTITEVSELLHTAAQNVLTPEDIQALLVNITENQQEGSYSESKQEPPIKNTMLNEGYLLFHNQSKLEASSNQSIDQQTIAEQFSQLKEEAKALIKQFDTNSQLSRSEQMKLLKVMQQWISLEQASGQTTSNMIQQGSGSGSKEEQVWKQMLNVYQMRNDLQSHNKYQANSSLTGSDISKMLKAALARYSNQDAPIDNNAGKNTNEQSNNGNQFVLQNASTNGATPFADVNLTSMQQSKVEQFVVHANQTSNSQAVSQEKLLNEIQSIIKSSKFLSNNGTNQLHLKLRPENLGDMMVKMMQVNGEMIVKITVNSQMAKDMLEGNMQQLRHMFSPQQVVVEKQDMTNLQQDTYQPEKQDQHQSFNQSNQEDTQDDSSKQQEDEQQEQSFRQILLNEKV